ncbi:ATP-dependent zinc metalloprotease FtsH [Bythopirellula goksoeyrii]|uniref:ATP-dependent zinc metalloprotease FtsH n=1 Tax=Bythopirellula goksoeyrii TaxID=1400387 RepID=A0A5B9QFZ9_9BACT|nr:ATP-dependent zinc metalloprotease FtsH [Bythopirellula goksoeyrii]QEG37948.1 ATP-dependent zinc metalloprotease FtsH 4 [Bythopirellula goksoeyrii]
MDDSPNQSKGSSDKKPNPQSGNLVWYVLGLMALLLLLGTLWGGQNRLTIKWSDLERLIVKSDEPQENWINVEDTTTTPPRTLKLYGLSDIKIGNTEVTGNVMAEVLTGGPPADKSDSADDELAAKGPKSYAFRTNRLPNEQMLLTLLHDHGLEHTMAESPSPFLSYLPMLTFTGLLILLMVVMMRRMGGAGSPMAFGRSRAKLYVQEDIEVTFDDVAGVDEAVDELREVVDFLKNPERYQQLGGRIPKGVLLVGPPGTGKTLLAKAVAGEAGVSFFSLSGSDFVEMFVGVGAARVRDMFSQAEQRAPCIIFIDELDALGKTRGSGQIGGHDEREQTLNALLVEMDGFGSNSGVIVMAATNRPETLDPALLRPGRFDRHVLVDRPDVSGREEILEVHLVNIKVADDVKVKEVAAITSGFVGADLANVVNEAALLAARKGKKAVTRTDFLEAVERASIGLEKKSRIIHDEEKIRLAYHEAGHALVAFSLPNTDPVHKVSIIPRGLSALGYMQQRPDRDRYMMTRGQLESGIQVALAGTLAEELIFDEVATGASNDLERATEIARSMVMDYGMSRLGRVNYRENNRNPFLATGAEGGRMATHSEQTAREIDQEVKRLLDESLDRARSILENRRAALVAISEELMIQEVIDAEELKRIVEENSPSPMIVPGTDSENKRTAKTGEAKTDTATGS